MITHGLVDNADIFSVQAENQAHENRQVIAATRNKLEERKEISKMKGYPRKMLKMNDIKNRFFQICREPRMFMKNQLLIAANPETL
jgi:hypothetical protein